MNATTSELPLSEIEQQVRTLVSQAYGPWSAVCESSDVGNGSGDLLAFDDRGRCVGSAFWDERATVSTREAAWLLLLERVQAA